MGRPKDAAKRGRSSRAAGRASADRSAGAAEHRISQETSETGAVESSDRASGDKSNRTAGRTAFKDYFGAEAARQLAEQVAAVDSGFHRARFLALATDGIEALEMMDRVRKFAGALAECLPQDVTAALDVLTRSLPPKLERIAPLDDGFVLWPIGQFIADRGLPHFDPSMTAMVELTQRFTSEFAVRPFVKHEPERTFERLLAWTGHESVHVRRWCSEGVRPRLPWGERLDALVLDPGPILPILDALKDDPEPYVRRSVANNLNDIAKDHPGLVLDIVGSWLRGAPQGRRWVVQHGLRSLVKLGRADALSLLGFAPAKVQAELSVEPSRVAIGEAVKWSVTVRNLGPEPARVVVDLRVHFMRARGPGAPKVFKGRALELRPGEEAQLVRTLSFRPTTVRRLYPGPHRLEAQVNGVVAAATEVKLDP